MKIASPLMNIALFYMNRHNMYARYKHVLFKIYDIYNNL